MNTQADGKLYIALLHYPVLARDGQIISTAITNVDLHDLARLGRTYGSDGVFIVTPISRQLDLVQTIRDHWSDGPGGRRIPSRAQALALVEQLPDFDAVLSKISELHQREPNIVVTGAQLAGDIVQPSAVGALLNNGETVLLVFGTGWGLADPILERATHRLAPINGVRDGWNHLSVRSAVAIILDRVTRNWSPGGDKNETISQNT